ncbi:MAG: NAD(P)-binding protein [Candidatus Methanomethylicus sp.]|nr:NAD(P)-binding protein [Candidatus Methanomethylicus sp.]
MTPDRILKGKYDVIVIGAGLGGLTAASLLAKQGINVIVIEQHCLPGGACTSFRREGRVFDSGAALIFGFGNKGYNLHHILVNILEEPITIIPREKFFRLDFSGQEIMVWKDLDKFLPELEKYFPKEKDELEELYGYLTGLYKRYIENKNILTPPSEMSDSYKMKMLLSNPLRVVKLTKLISQSAKDLMGPYIKSQRLLEFYDKLCASYAYTSMSETPAIMALTMFTDNHNGGTYYVAGGAQTYTNLLEKAIEKYGGTMLYRKKVEKIIFEGNKACGVRLSEGQSIKADRVLSDTTVWNLFLNLIPQEKVTDEQKKWVNALVPTYPAMVLYAVIDKQAFPPDTNPVEYFISNTSNIDMGDITMYIPTIDDHSLCPEDEHIVTIFSPAPDQKWPRPFEKEYQTEEYKEKKRRQADLIVDEITKRFPEFRKGIRKLIIATPSTIERYTLKTWGCVGGPKQMMGQELTKRLHAKTAWQGVYACGDSTTMGMGTPAVVASGFGAANLILREMGKPEFSQMVFEKDYVRYIKENQKSLTPESISNTPGNASLLARECQYCESQPCKSACPVGIDIAGVIRRIEAKNFVGAARLIRDVNPLEAICSYICPSEERCEKACVRKTYAIRAVKIRELFKWVMDYAGRDGQIAPMETPIGKKACVIGGGASGLVCAHFLARLGFEVDIKDRPVSAGTDLYEAAQKGAVHKQLVDDGIASLMLPPIKYHGNWVISGQSELKDLCDEYDAVIIATKHDYKTTPDMFVEGFPKVLAISKISMDSTSYDLTQAVIGGRNAAARVSEMINRSSL